jgi:glycine C-acetyltransferase
VQDALICYDLNHASIIDGVRLCKATRYRYKNNDMADLEAKLQKKNEVVAELLEEHVQLKKALGEP